MCSNVFTIVAWYWLTVCCRASQCLVRATRGAILSTQPNRTTNQHTHKHFSTRKNDQIENFIIDETQRVQLVVLIPVATPTILFTPICAFPSVCWHRCATSVLHILTCTCAVSESVLYYAWMFVCMNVRTYVFVHAGMHVCISVCLSFFVCVCV